MRCRDAAGLAILALAIALEPACGKPLSAGVESATPSAVAANSTPTATRIAVEDANAIPDSAAGSGLGYYEAEGYPVLSSQGVSPGEYAGLHTWRWRDGSWRHLAVSGSPYTNSNMAYDPDLRMTVVIGGPGTVGWNGNEWVDLQAKSPNTSSAQYLAFDQKRNRLTLTAADSNGGSTYAFAGGAWTRIYSGGPREHFGSAFAYDPRSGNTLLVGGSCSGDFCRHNDMWSWDGASWSQLHPKTFPTSGSGLLAFYPATQQMIFLARDKTTWNWDGTNWTQLRIESPPIGGYAGLVYDRARDQLFLWGGTLCYGRGSWTWTYRSGAWTFLTASSTTSPMPSLTGPASPVRLGNCY